MATKARRRTSTAARTEKARGADGRVRTRRAVRPASSRRDLGPIPRAIAVAVASGETISVGVLRLVKTTLVTVGTVATQAVKGTMQAAGGIGGDFGGAAQVATRAVKAGGEAGADVSALALNAARGALNAADRMGSAAGRAVRTTVDGTVAGVRSLVASPPPRRPLAASPGRRTTAKARRRSKARRVS